MKKQNKKQTVQQKGIKRVKKYFVQKPQGQPLIQWDGTNVNDFLDEFEYNYPEFTANVNSNDELELIADGYVFYTIPLNWWFGRFVGGPFETPNPPGFQELPGEGPWLNTIMEEE